MGLLDRASVLLRSLNPWSFPLLYLGWAYLFWIPIVISGEHVWSYPTVLLLLVGGLSPLLSGLFLMQVNYGRIGFKDLYNRLVEFGRININWLLVILFFYPVFNLVMAAIAVFLGITSSPIEFISSQRLFSLTGFSMLLGFAFLFPLIEEIGLRGYWFDQLQSRWSALTSSLILGLVWGLWHIPLVYMTGYYSDTTFNPELWWWIPSMIITAIIATWIYNNTKRSVLAVVGLHFMGNLTGETMGFSPEMYPFAITGTLTIAILLLVYWGPESLRKKQPKPTPNYTKK
ncbi:type II CAAX endopeptidase family protein [Methanonatronarchaeum sp. AMET-Sl]|uniref:CPBP family intramembrane glutamic endopeptidase n=1 Tax=Methanonatronarchaeum sp. AMET-Sl TaxID=3037654 RepID=UPI00244E3726|nr:type II CAAX endopeptidase family protein [Methanonatronarchaeum sp. AMET-Sl]WGI17695.1 type II CAAX endopeptidase family protein [Methanonatronarchaeum sp. AMET-Sl]